MAVYWDFLGVIGLTAGLLWLFNDNDFNQYAHQQTELIPERHHNYPDNTDKYLTENDPLTSSGSKNGGLANTESTSSELVNNELTDVESTDNESTGLGSKNAGLTNTALTGLE